MGGYVQKLLRLGRKNSQKAVLFGCVDTHQGYKVYGSLARLLCRMIERADPGHAPHTHTIRSLAASLGFFRTHCVEWVQDLGDWASAGVFRTRYIYHSVSIVQCVSMGMAPLHSSQEIRRWAEG